MFNKLKQFKDLRNQAKQLKEILAQEKIENEYQGIKIVMNGNLEIISLNINPQLTAEQIEKILPEALNQTLKKAQRLMAQKFQDMGGGLNLPS